MKTNPEGIAFLKENGFKVIRYTKTPEIFTDNPEFTLYSEGKYVCAGYCIENSVLFEYSRKYSEHKEAHEIMKRINDMFCYPTIGEKRNVLVEKYISKVEESTHYRILVDDDFDLPF